MTRELQTSAVIGGRRFHLFEMVFAESSAREAFRWVPADYVIVGFDGDAVEFMLIPVVDSDTERTRVRVSRLSALLDEKSVTAYGSASAPVWGY